MSRSEHDQRIAEMFDRVAPRYEPLNRLLSFGRDVGWRARAVELARLGANEIGLDVGVGTGDLTFGLLAASDPTERVVAGFTVRNFGDLASGLREMRRVLRPSGRAVILELSTPPNALVRAAYGLYFHRISPLVAAMAGGDPEAYRYLPRSVAAFPDADGLAAALRDAGFARVRYQPLTLGIAAIHVGEP